MQLMVDALEIILLAAIVAELYWLIQAIKAHKIGNPEETSAAKGQVINVNVGASLGGIEPPVSPTAPVDNPPESPPEVTPLRNPVLEEPADRAVPVSVPVDREALAQGARATVSGLVANKCPKCGMENSSFRTECFNCGGSLKH